MANIGQVYHNVQNYNVEGGYSSSGTDIYSNFIDENTVLTKLGIQAPSGSKVVINKTKTVMIGRSGTYELDEDIAVSNLYFIRPKKYELDIARTEEALAQGTERLEAAEATRSASLAALDRSSADYWTKYIEIQTAYAEVYSEAYALYLNGINGIYVTAGDGDLMNVIVDFMY